MSEKKFLHAAYTIQIARLTEITRAIAYTYNDNNALTFYYDNVQFFEIHGSDGWGLLCAEDITPATANVICRETKGMFALRVRMGISHSTYSGVRYRAKPVCKGDELSLKECSMDPQNTRHCSNGDLVVDCSASKLELFLGIMHSQ